MTDTLKPIITAGWKIAHLPVDDPVVKTYIDTSGPYIPNVIQQINDFGTYRNMFCGKEHLTFLDLGANIGCVSVFAHDVCDRIVAVEACPDAYNVLEAVAKRFPNIEPMPCAVAPEVGIVTFHVNDINPLASSVVNTHGKEIQVSGQPLVTILTVNHLEKVDVCKVDIEGSEHLSLSDEQVKLAKPIIASYFIETHNCPATTWTHKLGELVKVFAENGYSTMKIAGMGLYVERT